jgi:replication factor C subunit 3/5
MEPDWEVYLRDTARMIGEQQTPQRLNIPFERIDRLIAVSSSSILEARERLYELIAHCIPAEVIFKVNEHV